MAGGLPQVEQRITIDITGIDEAIRKILALQEALAALAEGPRSGT